LPGAAVQDAKLLPQHPPDNEQRFNQDRQVGLVLDQLLDPRLELHLAMPTLRQARVKGDSEIIIFNRQV